MVVSEKVMDALKSIGLNLYERKIWVALLGKGSATAGELAEIANVPRSRAYDILESLAEKGFVIFQSGRPIRFLAVDPHEAFERVKKKLYEDYQKTVQKIDEIKNSEVLKELKELYEKGIKTLSLEEITGALKGRYSMLQQIESMLKNAKDQINLLATPEMLSEILKNHFSLLKEVKEKGVKIRILVPKDDQTQELAKAFKNIAEIRLFDPNTLPVYGNVLLVDGKELMMGLTNPKEVPASQDIAFWSKSEHASTQLFSPFFELLWDQARKV
jgi:sugar-specific transcriptional regulator TrmB